MHNRIIQDYPKLFLGVDEKVIPSNESHLIDCDHIPHPSLERIRNFCKNNKKFKKQDVMEELENYVNKYRLDINEKDKAFFFSCELDGTNNDIILGTGADDDHFRVCMSSISLLTQCNIVQFYGAMYHIDGTYKILFENFLLVCFIRTVLHRQIHLIAFMLTSHETPDDYEFFYLSLYEICKEILYVL